MNEQRIAEIKSRFEGIGTVNGKMYTNQEIVDELRKIQRTMIEGIFETTHAEHLREKDLLMHIRTLAKEFDIDEGETFKRFDANMTELGYTIGTFIKGMSGERIAKRSLQLLSYDTDVRILYNIALENNYSQAEYDAIIISPYGLFIVEVKNWSGTLHIDEYGLMRKDNQDFAYDIAGRFNAKEYLLRDCLKDQFPARYNGYLLIANDKARIKDDFNEFPICMGGAIVSKIRENRKNETVLSKEQIDRIAETLMESHKEQLTTCDIDCAQIVDDYAYLMATIEDCITHEQEAEDAMLIENESTEEFGVKFDKTGVIIGTLIATSIAAAVKVFLRHK